MRNTIIYFILSFSVLFNSCKKKEEDPVVVEPSCISLLNPRIFHYAGVNRMYLLYLPDSLPANSPLVFVLHGRSQNAQQFYDIGFNKVADTAKFAVCYPQGIDCSWDVTELNSIDEEFLKALALDLQSKYSLNPLKTFATGFSMGGAMCNILALNDNDVFKAVASVAGFIYPLIWDLRNPQNAIPYFAIHGTADQIVSINGLGGGLASIQNITEYWSQKNNCTTSDTLQYTTHTQAIRFLNGTNGNEVWFYKIYGQDHIFPGDPNPEITPYDVSGFNGCTEIWKFFRKW